MFVFHDFQTFEPLTFDKFLKLKTKLLIFLTAIAEGGPGCELQTEPRLNINHRTYESLRVANLAILKPYEVTSPELFTSNLLKPYFGALQEGVAAAAAVVVIVVESEII